MPALPCHPAMHLLSCVDLLHALHTHAYVSGPTPDCTQHQLLGLKLQTAEKNLAAEHRHAFACSNTAPCRASCITFIVPAHGCGHADREAATHRMAGCK